MVTGGDGDVADTRAFILLSYCNQGFSHSRLLQTQALKTLIVARAYTQTLYSPLKNEDQYPFKIIALVFMCKPIVLSFFD